MNDNCTYPKVLNPNQSLLKPGDVAEFLNISRSFTYHLLQTGEIPSIRLGKACRVRPQDLVEFIEKNIQRQADDG